jgi:uncharacterized protein YraI
VTAEAIGSANVRTGPGTNYDLIGKIESGTAYRIVGRSAYYPWYLLSLPNTLGWVFKDLVTVRGDLNNVPFTEMIVTDLPLRQPTATEFQGALPPTRTATLPPTPEPQVTYVILPNATDAQPAALPTLPQVTGVQAKVGTLVNVRYGPSVNDPIMGQAYPGQTYPVLRRHSNGAWVEIQFPGVAWQRGWVSLSLTQIVGDLSLVPVVSGTEFGYPKPTALPPVVAAAVPPWATPPAAVNPVLTDLSNQIGNYLISRGFVPGTPRQASVFLMNLQTGHAFSVNPNVAYTGASILKVPVLVALYRRLTTAPDVNMAFNIGSMIVCSENTTSNTILSFLGDGDIGRGAAFVTETMRGLGLRQTVMSVGFRINNVAATLTPFPGGFTPPVVTGADQVSTQPDPEKQTTPADIGFLLAALYQCALDGTGPLVNIYRDQITVNECRQIIFVLKSVVGGAMIPNGVPDDEIDVQVAHKRGLIEEMNGDAGLVLTPGGDYVLVIMMRQPVYLNPTVSFPVAAEVSRLTYNAFNASRPLREIRAEGIPACSRVPAGVTQTLAEGRAPFIK